MKAGDEVIKAMQRAFIENPIVITGRPTMYIQIEVESVNLVKLINSKIKTHKFIQYIAKNEVHNIGIAILKTIPKAAKKK